MHILFINGFFCRDRSATTRLLTAVATVLEGGGFVCFFAGQVRYWGGD